MKLPAVMVVAMLAAGGCQWLMPTSRPTTEPTTAATTTEASTEASTEATTAPATRVARVIDPTAPRAGGNWVVTDAPPWGGEASGVGEFVTTAPADPRATMAAVRVEVWLIELPAGVVSRSGDFWKRVDENPGSVAEVRTREIAYRNGFRVGTAAVREWAYFRDLLEKYPVRSQLSAFSAAADQAVEIPTRKGIDGQTLTFLGDNGLDGRTYDRCDNIIQLGFSPAPRGREAARLVLTPMVRAEREKLEYTPLNQERQVRFVRAERWYESHIEAEVPFGRFLVVAPGPEADRATSLGQGFMVLDRDSERKDLLLLIVPSAMRGKQVTPKSLPARP